MKKLLTICICMIIFLSCIQLSVSAKSEVRIQTVIANGGRIDVKLSGQTKTDDGEYSFYAQMPYETGTEGKFLGSTSDTSTAFSFTSTGKEDLYKRIIITGKVGGKTKVFGTGKYPFIFVNIASRTVPRFRTGKKGVLLSAEMVEDTHYLYELGSCQVIYNVMVGDLCKNGDIAYEYNGKKYYFNSAIAGQYDHVLSTMEKMNIQTTFVVLNNDPELRELVHPNARSGCAKYYAFDTTTKAGVDALAAAMSFLAERYSNGKYGTVDNWIIGNEVNVLDWNYLNASSLDEYVAAYADVFRIAYTAIKTTNANARVYISLDNQWTAHMKESYAGRNFLETFADKIKMEGDIDWHVAIHPYNYPLTSTDCENQVGHNGVTDDINTTYITMQNIGVLTDYLHQFRFQSASGETRSVLCSEQGYTSSGPGGEAAQAAAVQYAFSVAAKNPDIDGFLLNRQQDAPEEIEQGLALGLMDVEGNKKQAYEAYKKAR